MTIPWLMNCQHLCDGWCLECVKKQHAIIEAQAEYIVWYENKHKTEQYEKEATIYRKKIAEAEQLCDNEIMSERFCRIVLDEFLKRTFFKDSVFDHTNPELTENE